MPSIKETLEKIKPFYPILLIVVFSGVFFTLGRISAIKSEAEPIKIEYTTVSQTGSVIESGMEASADDSKTPAKTEPAVVAPTGEVIGSKSGKKYYFPWCGTVKRIKPENQVHFTSIEEAKKAGFTAGGNCKGLE